jgi:HSP20 family molecular chaperone IbpA
MSAKNRKSPGIPPESGDTGKQARRNIVMWMTRINRPFFHDLRLIDRQIQRLEEQLSDGLGWQYDDQRVVVTAELPGVSADTLDIAIEGRQLTIKAERPATEPAEGAVWLRRERPAAAWAWSLRLPWGVESDRVTAALENGILTLTLPRREAEKPHRIAVHTS